MPRVAIIGSCVTRDLWPIRGDALENVLYISRTSLPSLFSAPVAGFRPAGQPPGDLTRYQHNAVVADLCKTALSQLAAFEPTHLIFDFIDERFDLLVAGESVVTCSWELEVSGYREQPALHRARLIPRLSAACDRLWIDAAGELAAVIRASPLHKAQLILHTSRWASEHQSVGGEQRAFSAVEILPGEATSLADQNALLATYEARFVEVMPPLATLDAGALRVANETHQWGLSPFHYIPEYYAEIWRQLAPLGLDPSA